MCAQTTASRLLKRKQAVAWPQQRTCIEKVSRENSENLPKMNPLVLPVAVCASSCSCNYLGACGAEDRHCHVCNMRVQLFAPTSTWHNSAQSDNALCRQPKPYKTLN